ncbi:hypothetical protein PC129_g12031 [Phytophthora cactorum]|uniref:Tc1-like transposase DDE domain-containing protein n=1 Tax=Phytophthora cactorum TaxID=29920 RepID=A0A8T1HW30_9STRA|nr:hypothetical protein PC129_g12031 [Phytophthora cactorum]
MARGRVLTEKEKGEISALHKCRLSERAIAKVLERSRPLIHAYLTCPDTYTTTKRPGRPKQLTPTAERRLFQEASKGKSSAPKLKTQLHPDLSARRIRELLQKHPGFKFDKRMASPVLTKHHKANRLKWAREKVTWDAAKWSQVVFSDEKKFNLDGPDDLQFYWHDLRFETQIHWRHQSGGGSVMVLGAFCADGIHGRYCIFQQDNASIHSSRATKSFFEEENVTVMEWPAKSPDLNPIENMWGVLARAVYANGRQFETRGSLI